MQGFVYRAFECFVRDTYGSARWRAVLGDAGLAVASFEPMLCYPDSLGRVLARSAARTIGKSEGALLEDFGTYLVTHPTYRVLRRLLRFCGDDVVDFILSLDELPDRARLAVPDLVLPPIEVRPAPDACFHVQCGDGWYGFGHVLTGTIRAMADDYGALVYIEHEADLCGGGQRLSVTIHDQSFAEGREFRLSSGERW